MKTTTIILIALLALSCTKKKIAKDPPPAPTEITSDTVVLQDEHSAQNSLDYLGMYRGSLPCADCETVETSIELTEDFHFWMIRSGGKEQKREEISGTYSWNEEGTTIILDNLAGEPNQFLVTENSLIQLDINGNKIVGNQAEKYVLTKLNEAEAAKTDARLGRERTKISDLGWVLTEFSDKPVKLVTDKVDLQFATDNSFTAFAGCNRMRGNYKAASAKIAITNIIATKMACADMENESRLLRVLEQTDNFVVNREILLLRNGEKVLAKFKSVQK
ncbi:MAG: META domain-containing protein [Flavobacterium sp.]|nr:META domain-containing protein [Flavobacterium sp.]